MNDTEMSKVFVTELKSALGSQEPDQRFVEELRLRISSNTMPAPSHCGGVFTRKWSLAASALILALVTTVILIAGPRNVYGSILKLFGYIPGVGIVDLNEVRVLKSAVIQKNETGSLTVEQGLAGNNGTHLWLTFADQARSLDGAWLQAGNGKRFELKDWRFTPDKPGSKGVMAVFQPLPQDVMQTVLAFPEGWRIPLTWIAGVDANLASADLQTAQLPPTQGMTSLTSTPAKDTQTGCIETGYVGLCIQAAVRTGSGLQVLLEERPVEGYNRGSLVWHAAVDPRYPETGPWLEDQTGKRYPLAPWAPSQMIELKFNQQLLTFPDVPADSGTLRLVIPHVTVNKALQGEIVVNVGPSPQAGQTLPMDATVTVEDVPVHFSQAELRSDMAGSLRLKGLSNEITASGKIEPFIFELGRPERVNDLYGTGNKYGRISFELELIQQGTLLTGEISLPVVSGAFRVNGPFKIAFDAPAAVNAPIPEPQVIETGVYQPLQPSAPLPMDGYRHFDRPLKAGDLLLLSDEAGQTRIRAASPADQFQPQDVVLLPGHVVALHAHADGGGLDYVASNSKDKNGSEYLQQLYRLRFDQGAPKLLIGRFEINSESFAWSHDGKYLAWLVNDPQPGTPIQRQLHLLNTQCASLETCQPQAMETGNQTLSHLGWSPNSYRLAAGGVSNNDQSHMTDMFLITLQEQPLAVEVVNLTQSDHMMDNPPAQWSITGDALYYSCAAPADAVNNQYGLCRNDLRVGQDEIVTSALPWNMHAIRVLAGRQVIDNSAVLDHGPFTIRSYDLQTGEIKSLFSWPYVTKHFYQVAMTMDGVWLATLIPDLGGVQIVNNETRQKWSIASAEKDDQLLWIE